MGIRNEWVSIHSVVGGAVSPTGIQNIASFSSSSTLLPSPPSLSAPSLSLSFPLFLSLSFSLASISHMPCPTKSRYGSRKPSTDMCTHAVTPTDVSLSAVPPVNGRKLAELVSFATRASANDRAHSLLPCFFSLSLFSFLFLFSFEVNK